MKLSSSKITGLINLATEIARTERTSSIEYIDPENNKSKIALKTHTVIFGRRGSGKTTLLVELEKHPVNNSKTVWIDADDFKELTFPDTLLQVFRTLSQGLIKLLISKKSFWKFGRAKKIRQLIIGQEEFLQQFADLLNEFDESDVSQTIESTSDNIASAEIGLDTPVKATLGSAESTSSRKIRQTVGLESKKQRIDRLFQDYKNSVIECTHIIEDTLFLFLDDFYHLKITEQARVLDYIAKLFKNTNLYLKFCSISHRTVLFTTGEIIHGLQLGHDVKEINLDKSFKNFEAVDRFLHDFAQNVCKRVSIDQDIKTFFSENAWRQLILASGGVPRDFLNILIKALENVRQNENVEKIDLRQINEASNWYYRDSKRSDLAKDSLSDSSLLERLLIDLASFCIYDRKKNMFLIAIEDLEKSTEFEECLKQLCDFRFIHEVHENTSAANRPGRFRAYLLDVGIYAHPERRGANRVVEIPFWEKDDRKRMDQLRSAPVYKFKTKDVYLKTTGDPFAIGEDESISDIPKNIEQEKTDPNSSNSNNPPDLFTQQ